MPRPQGKRKLCCKPGHTLYKPNSIPMRNLERIELHLDEMEALRLADKEGLLQEDAATSMGVSRPTFTRIIGNARKKVATALWEGKALEITGGNIEFSQQSSTCSRCNAEYEGNHDKPDICPNCNKESETK